MGLPSSGQISMNDIRIEMGIPSQSPFGLNEARNGTYVALNTNSPTSPPSTGQVSLSSWYGYCQTCFSHSFSYNALLANKCVNNDPITIISDTDPIVVGSLLFLSDYSQAFFPYYYTDGTDWYYADTNVSEQTEVMSLGSCVSTATLSWTYSETGGANAEMRIYVNSVAVETRTTTSSGTYTGLVAGDTIYVEIELLGACSGLDDAGNVYSQSNRGTLVYADCFVASTGTYTSPTYTVVAGDAGTTITLDTYASCDSGCL